MTKQAVAGAGRRTAGAGCWVTTVTQLSKIKIFLAKWHRTVQNYGGEQKGTAQKQPVLSAARNGARSASAILAQSGCRGAGRRGCFRADVVAVLVHEQPVSRQTPGRSILVPRPIINPDQNSSPGHAHPNRRIGQEIRNADQGNPAEQRRGRALFFAIDKKAQAQPAPKQGGDQPARIEVKR